MGSSSDFFTGVMTDFSISKLNLGGGGADFISITSRDLEVIYICN